MSDLKELFFRITEDKRKLFFMIGGTILAILLIAIVLVSLFGGNGRKYNKYYNEAEAAYLARDYAVAEEKLHRAMDLKSTENAYLLMADIYCAQGETDRAIQLLYLGYSHIGGDRIADQLEKLKSAQGGAADPRPVKDSVTIAGKSFDGSTASLVLNRERLTADDLDAIASLTRLENLGISDCGVQDLGFLSHLTGLTFLQISGNSVHDLTPLSALKNLKTLYIDNNPIEDLEPLYSLGNLRTLSMKGLNVGQTELDDLRKALPNCSVYADAQEDEIREIELGGRTFQADVTELNLGGLGITDISALSACRKLEKLDLRDNKISDISPLVDLPNLQWLCIWNNDVEDIYPLLSHGGLKYLDADGNRISDVSVLEYLPNLEELWLNHNPLKSVEPLRSLQHLLRLGLADTDLDDDGLDCLMGMKQLVELNIKGNKSITKSKFDALQEIIPACEISHDEFQQSVQFGDKVFMPDAVEIDASALGVTDLSGLEQFSELKVLKLSGNRITDLSPLRNLTGLEVLLLDNNSISDLSPLSGHKSLRLLNLQDNAVSDLSPLADCVQLRTLMLGGNRIQTVTPLAACTGLSELGLDRNSISDISPLASLTELKTLNLEYNQIADLSALYSMEKLELLYLRGDPLTADDLLALYTSLPNCTILHELSLSPEDLARFPSRRPASGSDLG